MRTMSMSDAREAFEQLARLAESEDGLMLTSDDNTPMAVVLGIDHYRSLQGVVELAYSGRWSEIYADYERHQGGDDSDVGDQLP